MRIGHGYDVHRFGGTREFILGGVKIPYEKMLDAHSDGDVLVHAVIDALFGAAGCGDIGSHFPDTDAAFDGIDSLRLLRRTMDVLEGEGYSVVYIDCTVIAQRPKISPHISLMRNTVAQAMGISPDLLNIKATTEEHLGFTGEEMGIAAHAVCLLEKK